MDDTGRLPALICLPSDIVVGHDRALELNGVLATPRFVAASQAHEDTMADDGTVWRKVETGERSLSSYDRVCELRLFSRREGSDG